MKKTAVLAIGLALILSSVFVMLDMNVVVSANSITPDMPAAAGTFGGGDGRAVNPFIIEDVLDLQAMNQNLDANYSLGNDIDASETLTWNSGAGFMPIGNYTDSFTGSLDGLGYKITNLFINRGAENYIGLFGRMNESGKISNVGLSQYNITGYDYVGGLVGWNNKTVMNSYGTGNVRGHDNVGGFVGENHGTIENCHSAGSAYGRDQVGGFAGYIYGDCTITNCYSTGDATGTRKNAGGFVGWNDHGSEIENCYSTGNTSGDQPVGGFVGYNSYSYIVNCHSTGNSGGLGYTNGGFVGRNEYYSTIMNCYSTGNITGINYGYAGGFVGFNSDFSNITNCYSTGCVIGTGDGEYLGGFIFLNSDDSIIKNCYSTGNISGVDKIGGFTWGNDMGATILNCYSTGTISGTGIELSGFVRYLFLATVTDCFWDVETSGQSSSNGGTGNTTAEMKQQATFTNWDFTDVWGIVEDSTYPFLKTINPIVHTSYPEIMTNVNEDSLYWIQFENTVQPDPYFNKIENWTITNVIDWLAIDYVSCILSGAPTNADVGVYDVNIRVTDTLGKIGYFNYTLSVINKDPEITTADTLLAPPGKLYMKDYNSTDDGQGMISWYLETNAPWLNQNGDILTGQPEDSDVGFYWVYFAVDDGNGGIDYTVFTLEVERDTDHDGLPDATDPDDDNDDWNDTIEISIGTDPLDNTSMPSDTDDDGTPDSLDDDDDNDGWNDTIEIAGGFDPLDNTSVPGDEDLDGIADFMDPDFLGYERIVNQTVWNNQTVNQTVYSNNTVWQNSTNNVTIGVSDLDSDGDGWTDAEEILAGTDPLDDTDEPADADADGIADFMDIPDAESPETITKTPSWAWVALIAAVVLGVVAAVTVMKHGKGPKQVSGPKEPSEPGTSSPEQEPAEKPGTD